MRTVILERPGEYRLIQSEAPHEVGPGEALVRVHRVGVCGTDYHAFRGRQPFFTYPRILGHELGVEVLAVGDEPGDVSPGDRCALEPYLHCGRCVACRRGKTNCCADLKVLGVHVDGGMREQIVVPSAKLHRSESLPFEQLALVETLGIGAHAVARAALEPEEFVLVIGAGPIGLSVIELARLAGARVLVLDVNARRLEFCREHFGVDHAILASERAREEAREITGGEMATAVFDATGNAASMRAAFDFVASGGRLVLVGLVQDEIGFQDPDFHRKELTLLATRNSTAAEFRRILALMEAGRIDTRPWITHRARLEAVPDAFSAWLAPEAGVIKAIIEIE
jgi:2-desacetyl-2-hydroxyethyl bacteriochlorophyllide A dehydrogenase